MTQNKDTKGLTVEIYRNKMYAGCANGGVSERVERVERLTIVEVRYDFADPDRTWSEPVPKGCQVFTPDPAAPAARLVRRVISGDPYVHIEPLEPAPKGATGYMAGGCMVYTCDSRWKDLVGSPYPVQLHDRTETWTDHRILGQ